MPYLHIYDATLLRNFTFIIAEVTDEALFLDSQNTNKLEDFVIKNSFRELVFMCVRLQSSLLSSENEVSACRVKSD